MPHQKQAYSIQFKNQVLDWMHEDDSRTCYDAASHFQLQAKTIRNWLEQQADLRNAAMDGERLRLKKQTRPREDHRRRASENSGQPAYLPYQTAQKEHSATPTTEMLLMKLLQLL